MKSTGIVRPVDKLGRIVIPKEIRHMLNVEDDADSMEIFLENNMIILKKYEPACMFCGEAKSIVNFKGRNICDKCLKELGNLSE